MEYVARGWKRNRRENGAKGWEKGEKEYDNGDIPHPLLPLRNTKKYDIYACTLWGGG